MRRLTPEIKNTDETRKGKGKATEEKANTEERETRRQRFHQSVGMLKGEEEQETDEEDERVQVAPNKCAGGSHSQATLDPEEEPVEEERGTRKLRWADCDGQGRRRLEEESDVVRLQETAKERGERCEVWKERVSGRVEVRSEENKEPRGDERERDGQEKTIDEKPLGLEDVENESKTQEEEKQSRVESEQEVRRRRKEKSARGAEESE